MKLIPNLSVSLLLLFTPAAFADLIVSSSNNDRILRYDSSTGAFLGDLVPAGSGGLDNPWGLTVGPDGKLYIASLFSNQVLRYNPAAGVLEPFAASSNLSPVGLTFGPDGNLYVTEGDDFDTRVHRFNGLTGADMGVFASGRTGYAYGLTFGVDGNLYVANRDGNEIVRYNGATGTFLDTFAAVSHPRGLAFGPDGNLYVTNLLNNIVRCSSGTCVNFATLGGPGSDQLNTGLRFGPDGNIYAVHVLGNDVRCADGSTGSACGINPFVSSGSGGLSGPSDLIFFDVPEPGTWWMILSGFGLSIWGKQRRRWIS
ncbi:MAG: hypothetical protein U0R19_08335 [Bryobacteraceae bacterium]